MAYTKADVIPRHLVQNAGFDCTGAFYHHHLLLSVIIIIIIILLPSQTPLGLLKLLLFTPSRSKKKLAIRKISRM